MNLGSLNAKHMATTLCSHCSESINLKRMEEIPCQKSQQRTREQVASKLSWHVPVFFFCLFFFRYTFLFLQNKGPNPQLTKKIAGLNCGPERLNTVTPLGLVSWHSRHHKTCLCHCFLHCVLKKYLTKNKWLCVRSSLSFHDVLGHTLAEICAYLSYQCLLMP